MFSWPSKRKLDPKPRSPVAKVQKTIHPPLSSVFDEDNWEDASGPFQSQEDSDLELALRLSQARIFILFSVADPLHFGVDPDPRIHASD
jgi:hypothetical protein